MSEFHMLGAVSFVFFLNIVGVCFETHLFRLRLILLKHAF